QDDGLTAAQGGDGVTGFTAAAGKAVTVTLDGINGAIPDPITPNQAPADPSVVNGVTDASGNFLVTFTSATAGQVIGTASTTFTIDVDGAGPLPAASVTRDTDPATTTIPSGPGGTSPAGPATKTFVDAKITITPNDVNGVGDPHTFTVNVMQD